ncbi:MAG TPA: alpha/beta hydrolase-fold protein [Phenylobacterium sp.]
MHRIFTAALVVGFTLVLAAPAFAEPLKVVSTGLAAKMATEQLVVHSVQLDRDMLVEITHPFTPLTAGRRVPAVYVLDGGYEFAGLEGWQLGASGGMAEAYIITVGYRPADYGKRDADLTTQAIDHGGKVEQGRALAFRAFLQNELRPFVEGRYPVDPSQAVLVGHSSGGSFAAALFADEPGAFSGYVIGSPATWNEPRLVDRVAAARVGRARIYIAVGGNETARMTQAAAQMTAAFKSHASLSVRSHVFPGATHLSYYAELIAQGLPYVLPPAKP